MLVEAELHCQREFRPTTCLQTHLWLLRLPESAHTYIRRVHRTAIKKPPDFMLKQANTLHLKQS